MPVRASDIHIWLAPLAGGDPPPADELPAGERERAAKLARGPVRERWLAARWALRRVLATYLEKDPAAIELTAGERGKPMLATPGASLRFNLSHSGDLAMIAVTCSVEVGIDVERVEPRRNLLSLARRALPAEEVTPIERLPPSAHLEAFHAAWTRREAVAKCLDVGLGAPLPRTPVAVANFDTVPGHAAAVAVAGERLPPLQRFDLSVAARGASSDVRGPAWRRLG